MLVVAGGKTIGTLGGGCVEAEVASRRLDLLASDNPSSSNSSSITITAGTTA